MQSIYSVCCVHFRGAAGALGYPWTHTRQEKQPKRKGCQGTWGGAPRARWPSVPHTPVCVRQACTPNPRTPSPPKLQPSPLATARLSSVAVSLLPSHGRARRAVFQTPHSGALTGPPSPPASFGVVTSGGIPAAASARLCSSSRLSHIPLYVSHLFNSFLCCWTFRWFPCLECCKSCCLFFFFFFVLQYNF